MLKEKLKLSLLFLLILSSFAAKAQDEGAAVPKPSTDSSTESTYINPPVRSNANPELNHESSSYVTDPDNLDPLPLKSESLKDDDEVPLDDIKSLANEKLPTKAKKAKVAKKPKAKKKKTVVAQVAAPKEEKELAPEPVVEKPAKIEAAPAEPPVEKEEDFPPPPVKPPVINKIKKPQDHNRYPDEPNYALEKKFNYIYRHYNINPTNPEQWGVANAAKAKIYEVQKGDTLSSISETLFGDPQFWPKIWALNNPGIVNPHNILPGTKIYFYPGDDIQAPALSVGEPFKDSMTGKMAEGPDSAQNSTTDEIPQGKIRTEFNQSLEEFTNVKSSPHQLIPDSFSSLPSQRVLDSFKNANQETKIELHPFRQPERPYPVNPFVITSKKIETDFSIPTSLIEQLYCKNNKYVPKIKVKDNDENSIQPGRYEIVTDLTHNLSALKATYLYKKIGEVELNSDQSLRVKDCIENINSDVIFKKKSDLATADLPQEAIENFNGKIVDGVEVSDQQVFYDNQYLIVQSQQQLQSGQKVKIVSKQVGGPVGTILILDPRGPLSIGIVDDVRESIQKGDDIVLQ